jgi:hypothetical protein
MSVIANVAGCGDGIDMTQFKPGPIGSYRGGLLGVDSS